MKQQQAQASNSMHFLPHAAGALNAEVARYVELCFDSCTLIPAVFSQSEARFAAVQICSLLASMQQL